MSEDTGLHLVLASRLLEYPDEDLFSELADIRSDANKLSLPARELLPEFLDKLENMRLSGAQEHYVRIFDHDPAASLYLSWHRYGNDRAQGKAMAALNGLYRASGFEPLQGVLPDYLPRMLEFLAVCEAWACETLLDGFGPELAKIEKRLEECESPYALLLKMAFGPLREKWPSYFQPRIKPDRTKRPMAQPEEEESLFADFPGKKTVD